MASVNVSLGFHLHKKNFKKKNIEVSGYPPVSKKCKGKKVGSRPEPLNPEQQVV